MAGTFSLSEPTIDPPNMGDRDVLQEARLQVARAGYTESNVKKLLSGARLLEKLEWIKPVTVPRGLAHG